MKIRVRPSRGNQYQRLIHTDTRYNRFSSLARSTYVVRGRSPGGQQPDGGQNPSQRVAGTLPDDQGPDEAEGAESADEAYKAGRVVLEVGISGP